MTRWNRTFPLALIPLALLFSGCRHSDDTAQAPAKQLTQHEKDSILAQSTVPGAGVVKKALVVQDSLNKRTARADSIGRDTLR